MRIYDDYEQPQAVYPELPEPANEESDRADPLSTDEVELLYDLHGWNKYNLEEEMW